MYSRKNFADIKSLVHFDFPHYYALNSGLKDEIPGHVWNAAGNALFAGKYQPVDAYFSNAPKFGYRCLYTQSNSDYIFSSGLTGTIDPSKTFCTEIFINIQSSTAGNIIAFMNGASEILTLSLNAERKIYISAHNWNLFEMYESPLSLNSWLHIRLAVSNRAVTVYADGAQIISANAGAASFTFTGIRIGGANALLDEFILRDNIPSLLVPSQPYNLALDITKLGGFGTGRDGELIIDSGNISVNTYGHVTAANGNYFSVLSWGDAAGYKPVRYVNAGDEVMFLVLQKSNGPDDLCGLFAFRNIVSLNLRNFIVDAPVTDEFNMAEALKNYDVYCYKIPHFSKADISSNLRTNHYVAAFRCSGDVNFTGGTYVETRFPRNDSHNLTHSDLPGRMIPSSGNIIITCGGKFTAQNGARLGHEKSGTVIRPGGYGGRVINGENCIMIPNSPSSNSYGFNILIAAKRLDIDENALAYGARATNYYSGLCYLAGDLA